MQSNQAESSISDDKGGGGGDGAERRLNQQVVELQVRAKAEGLERSSCE
jgi:hypothetical protein